MIAQRAGEATLLTDPFLDPAPKYSATELPLREITITSDYVDGGLAIVDLLQDAGWTIVDSEPSTVVQWRPAFYFSTSIGAGTPVEMTAAQCTSEWALPWRTAVIGVTHYNFYDPYVFTPTCVGGTGNVVWVAAGITTWLSAQALATAMSTSSYCTVSVADVGGGRYEFTCVSKAAAFEYDDISIQIGGTMDPMLAGYHVLRSPSVDGVYLEIKVQTDYVSGLGLSFSYGGGGTIRVVLTVSASGGGTFQMPFFPGEYIAMASEPQVLIMPVAGAVVTRASYSTLLASLVQAPDGHSSAGTCPVVIGSDNGQQTGNTDPIRQVLHWGAALACGHNGAMTATRKGWGPMGYQIIPLLVRGTTDRATVSLAGQPLIQAPYIAVPANPTTGPEAVIVGKLWDMVITSGTAAVGAKMVYDSKRWTCIGTRVLTGDIGADLWILGG